MIGPWAAQAVLAGSGVIVAVAILCDAAVLCGAAYAAPSTVRSVPVPDNAAPLSFYVVKGQPGACGDNCDTWIAADGKVDNAAAERFRKFLKQIGDRHLPIYFNSPGGNTAQALAIGNMLRANKAMARVGRTVVQDCGFEPQDGAACIKLKQSGRQLTGELWTRGATCNSACPYMMLGAPNREVAPDAFLSVHSPHVFLNFVGGVPPREVRARAIERALTHADGAVSGYLRKMGIEQGLLSVARAVKFEDLHVLTRDEIAAFGIDRRPRVETPWTFEQFSRGLVYKTLAERGDDKAPFRTTSLQLFCLDANQYELHFQRGTPSAASSPGAVTLALGTANRSFLFPPRHDQNLETWAMRISVADAVTLASAADISVTEKDTLAGGSSPRTDHFGTDNLRTALLRLMATCPPSRTAPTVPKIDAPFATRVAWPGR